MDWGGRGTLVVIGGALEANCWSSGGGGGAGLGGMDGRRSAVSLELVLPEGQGGGGGTFPLGGGGTLAFGGGGGGGGGGTDFRAGG